MATPTVERGDVTRVPMLLASTRDADTAAFDARAVGGKAARLHWLLVHGFHVPETWVIPERVFASVLRESPPACEPRSLLRAATGRTVYARAAEARQELLRAKIPARLEEELAALWRRVGASSPWGLAVRSSATCEDGHLVSMAGLAETRLGVRGEMELASAVREVWASVASGRALAYLAAHGVRDVGMAVVIQRMVEAEAAGVMFTRASDASGERIVNAGFGLGAPVVDGVTSPDVLRLSNAGDVTSRMIARKNKVAVIGEHGVTELPAPEPDAPALSDARVRDLAEIATKLESLERHAWDVEFACDRERTWVVQARPVTRRGGPEGGDETTVWSSANVGEALPGVATPFTWAIAGAYSESGFRRAFAALGCRVPKHAHLVGNVHGRFYLNLTQFMRIAAQVPWLDPRTLVELGGGAGGDELASQVVGVSRRGFYARLPMTASRLMKEQLRLDENLASFEDFAKKAMRIHHALDVGILPDEGVARTLRDVQALLERTGNTMLTCASSSLGTHLALKALLVRASFDAAEAERLAQGLVRGVHDLESARPALGIARIADLARKEPDARVAILRESTRAIADVPDGATRRAITTFLEAHGDRAVREAELSTPRWREDPVPVLTMIRIALRAEGQDVEVALSRAKAAADAEMSELEKRLGFVEHTVVRHLVARAQKSARLRERMRSWVTRVLGMVRTVALDADRRLLRLAPELAADQEKLVRAASPIAHINSVFFLTVDEVVQALRASRTDLAPLVRARRAEFARDAARPDPPATFVGVPPPVVLPSASGDVLRGLGASGGAVEGRARVLSHASEMGELVPGEILVVHSTDVGWTPLFLVAAGVVTELGGALSHAAVIARELGVPSVVNVDGVTRVLKTGDRVRVNGDRGTVERLPT